jgi:DNA mismatch repair ATPase MutS
MPAATLKKTYSARERKFSDELAIITRRINLISNLRLAVALLTLAAIYFSFLYSLAIAVTVLLVVLFFYFVQLHARLFLDKVHLENLVKINAGELQALSGNFSAFASGDEFIDAHHPYSHDLDMFGDGSVFQYINRCNTINGKKKLAYYLNEPVANPEKIRQNQDCIRDLAGRIDFRQHVQAAGMETGEQKNDYHQLLQWTAQPSLLSNDRLVGVIIWVIPAITILALIGTFFLPQFKLLLMVMVIIQWIIAGSKLKKINVFHDYIGRKKNILQKYSRLLLHVENEKFAADKLTKLSGQAQLAHERINELASLVSALDARTNSMTTLVVNSLLLYDLQCVYRLEKWKEKNSAQLPLWLDTITEIEALNSFGTYASNNPGFTFASISSDLKIAAMDMAHPLLSESERVVNSMTIGPDATIMIITGANMAGKSTFLRTLGVNVVLALNGAPVCASNFSCPILEMRSGMRTADSLRDHQSYFYAELNRLKNIMDELRRDKPLLILLDEILKGTNSNDKQAGSIALVRQLLPHPCLALIATHDLALGELEKEFPQRIRNYCFEANIENEQLSFDYKLKVGVAQKMNASFLMKKMGIIPS